MEIKVGRNMLFLKCLVLDNMKYHMVLGRDMLDHWMTGMDHTQNAIFFRKNESKEDIEKKQGPQQIVWLAGT